MKRIVAPAFIIALAACGAHTNMRGSVVMKVNDTEAHICLGKGEVHEGSVIELYRNVCTDAKGRPVPARAVVDACKREPAGSGQVTRVLNDHYSIVRFASGTSFQEGDTVEAHR